MFTAITPPNEPSRTTSAAATTAARCDRVAGGVLAVCAIGALLATAATVGKVADAEGALKVAETWRLAGLPVFAGLFAILAWSPRRVPGLWELVIANKIFLVAAGATYLSDIDGGSEFVLVDGVLAILLIVAYALANGWTAWSRR